MCHLFLFLDIFYLCNSGRSPVEEEGEAEEEEEESPPEADENVLRRRQSFSSSTSCKSASSFPLHPPLREHFFFCLLAEEDSTFSSIEGFGYLHCQGFVPGEFSFCNCIDAWIVVIVSVFVLKAMPCEASSSSRFRWFLSNGAWSELNFQLNRSAVVLLRRLFHHFSDFKSLIVLVGHLMMIAVWSQSIIVGRRDGLSCCRWWDRKLDRICFNGSKRWFVWGWLGWSTPSHSIDCIDIWICTTWSIEFLSKNPHKGSGRILTNSFETGDWKPSWKNSFDWQSSWQNDPQESSPPPQKKTMKKKL